MRAGLDFERTGFFGNPNRGVLRRDGSVGNRDAAPANEFVNEPDRKSELNDLRSSAQRGRPFGSENWGIKIARQLGLGRQ